MWTQYPRLRFDEESHTYTWDGVVKPSSTQILSSVYVQKNGSLKPVGFDNRYVTDDTASKFGTAFHKIASIILKGKEPEYPKEIYPWVYQFKRFLDDNKIKLIYDLNGQPIIEYPMYSQKYGYCGTPDLICFNEKETELWVVDWKTSTTDQKYWDYQTASYEKLVEEIFAIGLKVIRKTVRISSEKYEVKSRKNNILDWSKFQSCLNVYNMAA